MHSSSARWVENTEPFFEQKGQSVGLKVKSASFARGLTRKLEHSLGGPVKVLRPAKGKRDDRPDTGGAGSEIYAVADEGIDTLALAKRALGRRGRRGTRDNLLLGGHYATRLSV